MNTTSRLVIVAGLALAAVRLPAQQIGLWHTFEGAPSDGAYSHSSLVRGLDGSLYGTTTRGGANDGGTVFKMDFQGTVTLLHSFGAGALPSTALIEASDGFFYGTTYSGGAHNLGSVFKIAPDGTGFMQLHSFDGTDGENPQGALVEGSDGNFYGTTPLGGDNGSGTVFQMIPSGTVTTLHSFGSNAFEGPRAGLIQVTGDVFYGTTAGGGANQQGSIFEITSTGDFTQLHSFDGSDGLSPNAPLRLATDGKLYGTTLGGGDHNGGVVFVIDTNGNNFSVLVHLAPVAYPTAGLLELADGRLYGAIRGSGLDGDGALFKVNPTTGKYTRLASFDGADGQTPAAALVLGTDGQLYGTTTLGGASGWGVIYSLCTPTPSPSISSETCILANTSSLTASVDAEGGNTYSWTVVGGTIDGGQGTPAISYTSGGPGTRVTILIGESNATCTAFDYVFEQTDFADVPPSDNFYAYICAIGRNSITSGCGNGNYCRDAPVTRAQMAVFLEKSVHGSSYSPPPCTGLFPDVPCPSQYANWIEELSLEGITGGCGNGDYCPDATVTRRQMAVFLLKASHGFAYVPPSALGIFQDVPVSDPFAPWIEDLYNYQITGGCQASPLLYCPDNPNTRGQMAVFLTKTFLF